MSASDHITRRQGKSYIMESLARELLGKPGTRRQASKKEAADLTETTERLYDALGENFPEDQTTVQSRERDHADALTDTNKEEILETVDKIMMVNDVSKLRRARLLGLLEVTKKGYNLKGTNTYYRYFKEAAYDPNKEISALVGQNFLKKVQQKVFPLLQNAARGQDPRIHATTAQKIYDQLTQVVSQAQTAMSAVRETRPEGVGSLVSEHVEELGAGGATLGQLSPVMQVIRKIGPDIAKVVMGWEETRKLLEGKYDKSKFSPGSEGIK